MKRILLIALLVSMVLPVGLFKAHAEADGNDLLKMCEAINTNTKGNCRGYINGAAQVLAWTREDHASLAATICIPPESRWSQSEDITVSYLKKHPETRHHSAGYQISCSVGSMALPQVTEFNF